MTPVFAFWILFAAAPTPPPIAPSAMPAMPASPAPPQHVPPNALPILWHTPQEVEAAWQKIRQLAGAGPRLAAIATQGLERWACTGLVDLQALPASEGAGLAWKDHVRGRGWSHPALARALITAHADWHHAHPKLALAVGDVAQAGCGQVDPGVLTRFVSGPEATQLLARATPSAGGLVVREVVPADQLLDDPTRFRSPQDLVLLERRIIAAAPPILPAPASEATPTLLVQLRRYRQLPSPEAAAIANFGRDLAGIVARAELATSTETRDPAADPSGARILTRHFVDRPTGRQLVLVMALPAAPTGSPNAPVSPRAFNFADVRDARLGPWAPGRAGAFPSETRWIATLDPVTHIPSWRSWQLLEEGAHASHMAGRDADLSYPIADPKRRFIDAVEQVDLRATWDWFVALDAATTKFQTPLDAIMVGPRMYARLLREIPEARASRLIKDRIVRIIREHDDHQHIRIAQPTTEAAQSALSALAVTSNPAPDP